MTLTTWAEPLVLPAPRGEAVVRLPSLDELAERWSTIAPLLEKATRRTGCYEPIDVLQLAMTGKIGIWVCEVDGEIAAAFVSEVKQYPRRRVLEILFAGGNRMRDWLQEAIAAMDKHAVDCGCSHLASAGRRGWARACGGELTGDVVAVRSLRD